MLARLLLTGLNNMKPLHISHKSAFTLVELLVAITIMGMMITTTLMVYLNVWNTSLRMEMSRELSETARQITERIAQDVREEGINIKNISVADLETSYKWKGSQTMRIGNDTTTGKHKWQYIYGKDNGTWIDPCTESDKKNINVHCGLYIFDGTKSHNLVDAFTPLDENKRVKITDLAFYVSGSETTNKKVTLKMTLELTRKSGVPASLVRASKLEIQSTFSDSIFTYQK